MRKAKTEIQKESQQKAQANIPDTVSQQFN